jgi:hypothetical protein
MLTLQQRAIDVEEIVESTWARRNAHAMSYSETVASGIRAMKKPQSASRTVA